MDALTVTATKSTPSIFFDPIHNRIKIKGESFPENTAKFYEPVWSSIKEYLNSKETRQFVVEIELTYFNSSSSKAFMNFFEMLENAASEGKDIVVNWLYHPENETAEEAGEEFRDDVPLLNFNVVQSTWDGPNKSS
jgi:hypothetical protein